MCKINVMRKNLKLHYLVISLKTIFGPPPLLSILYMNYICNTWIGHVTAAPGSLACPSFGVRPLSLS